jgi:hypothetical protein
MYKNPTKHGGLVNDHHFIESSLFSACYSWKPVLYFTLFFWHVIVVWHCIIVVWHYIIVVLQGNYLISPVGYAYMTHMLSGLANGRVVLSLEVRCVLFLLYYVEGRHA